MSKHTPGPWKIDLYWKLESDPMWRCVVSEWTDDFQRMSVCGHIGEANARLIAAAPDMLAALIMVRDADDDCLRDGLPTIPPAARATIDAAIAKAEGA